MIAKFLNRTQINYGFVTFGSILLVFIGAMLVHAGLLRSWIFLVFCLLVIILAFAIQKQFVFKNTRKNLLTVFLQFVLFVSVIFFNLQLELVVTLFVPTVLAPFIAIILLIALFILSYFLCKRIFNTSLPQSSPVRSITFKKIGAFLLLCLPIIAFSFGLLRSGYKIIPGDPDYYLQIYEAFRKSLLDFHQLPFWNAWVDGGIPLFGNIQFGLVSLQSPFIILFGTVIGMKMAIVLYQIIGFFGFKRLFEKAFHTPKARAILLAYIPIFGSFFVERTIAGHFTFLLISFVPWLFLAYLQRQQTARWLYFALIYSFMVWSAPHYTTIMAMLVVGIWFVYETIAQFIHDRRKNELSHFFAKLRYDILFFLKAGCLIAILTFYRMFFVADFIKDFPRNHPLDHEGFTGLYNAFYAIWGPDQYANPPKLASGWGWTEASTYIGIGTLVCLLIVIGIALYRYIKKREVSFNYPFILLGFLFVTFFALGLGDFGKFSPYTLLNHLPIFDSMRVATRWLMWSSLFALCIIAAYKKTAYSKTLNALLLLAVIELFLGGSKMLGSAYFLTTQQYRPPLATFVQEAKYNIPRPLYSNDKDYLKNYTYDENLFEATKNNVGQVIAGDSLVDTRQPNTTIRCGEADPRCLFISDNARVTYWSPNKIVIERLMPGPINLDINPGRGWMVNGSYNFSKDKVTDPMKPFIINDPSSTLVLQYAPALSPIWIIHKLLH